MAEKKTVKKMAKKAPTKKTTAKKASAKKSSSKAKTKKLKGNNAPSGDMGIVIVDDDIEIDQEKVNEERRAYLEESRSQDAFD